MNINEKLYPVTLTLKNVHPLATILFDLAYLQSFLAVVLDPTVEILPNSVNGHHVL